MNFRGRSIRNLDPKGRLLLSPEYRESLALRMVNTQNDNTFTNVHASYLTQKQENIVPNNNTAQDNQNSSTPSTIYPPNVRNLSANARVTPQQEAHILMHPQSMSSTVIQEIKLVITTYDNCLAAYSWPDWLKLEEQFSRLTNPSSKVRAFRRLFIGGAEEQILDAQGRIRLSADHKEYAQLEKEVTVLGLITRFELWNPLLFKSHIAAQSLDDVTEELCASGIDFAL